MPADNDTVTIPAAEYQRLRDIERSVRYALMQEGDSICWRDLYSTLGKLLGLENYLPKLMDDPEKMHANCRRFIESLYSGPYVPLHTVVTPEGTPPTCLGATSGRTADFVRSYAEYHCPRHGGQSSVEQCVTCRLDGMDRK